MERHRRNGAVNGINLTSATNHPVTHAVGVDLTANGTLADSEGSNSNFTIDLNIPVHMIDLSISAPMIDLNIPYVPDGTEQITSRTISDLLPSEISASPVSRQMANSSFTEPGHQDNPIVIEDDEEDEHDDAQQVNIVDVDNLSYEGLLALEEYMGDVGTGLKKKVIYELLKQRYYQSSEMNNGNNSCSVCLETYGSGEVLGIIDCGHEFHYHCIRRWLKVKNFCPICKRTALTP